MNEEIKNYKVEVLTSTTNKLTYYLKDIVQFVINPNYYYFRDKDDLVSLFPLHKTIVRQIK